MVNKLHAVLLASLFAFSLAYLAPETASAQPTWSFWADVSGVLYPGEVHNVTVMLRNMQCVERREEIRLDYLHWPTLENAEEWTIEEFRVKAEEGVSLGIFRSYSILINQTGWEWISPYHQVLVHNITIVLRDYCVFTPIFVEKVRIWFPWRGYGRALYSEVNVSAVLRGYDVQEFPLSILRTPADPYYGVLYDYYRNISIPFRVPEDLPSEFLGEQGVVVEVDARTEGGVWTFGGDFGQPSVRVTGQVDVRPFRTFTLRVTDGEGAIPLGGAEVNLQAHVHPFSVKFVTDSSGTARVFRLPDQYTYRVTVLYRPPLLNESVPVLISDMDALSIVKGIKADLHTMRVFPRDLKGRPLEGARVIVDAISIHLAPGARAGTLSNGTAGGYAAFALLPSGNYTLEIEWKGLKVFRGHRYVGVHPTLGFQPTSISVPTSVDDLVVRAVDMAGNPVGAVFTVRGPTAETSFSAIEAPDGLLRLQQMPIAEYTVTAANRSKAFGVAVEATGEARPGELLEIRLPVFGVSLRAVSMDGKPLAGASIRFHTISAFADRSGAAVFPGVPEGLYEVEVTYGGVSVYSGMLEVRGNVYRDLDCAVYDVAVRFESADGKPVVVRWSLRGAGREYEGTGEGFAIELLPEQEYRLTATITMDGREVRLLEQEFRPSELRGAAIKLPIADLRIRVVWDDGTPFEGQAVVMGKSHRVVGGELILPSLPFGPYEVSLVSDGFEVLRSQVAHGAGEASITVQSRTVSVRVVDLLGRPVEGAGVSLQSPRAPGGTVRASTTEREGTVSWSRLPAALEPYWIVVSYAGQTLEQQAKPGENVVVLPGIVAGGTLIGTGALIGVAAALGAAAALSLLMVRTRRRAGKGTEE